MQAIIFIEYISDNYGRLYVVKPWNLRCPLFQEY